MRKALVDFSRGLREYAARSGAGSSARGVGSAAGAAAAEEGDPISFETFKEQRAARAKAEKKREEEEEKRRREEEEKARRRARAEKEKVVVDDEEELKGAVRGYKKRADGSTTSYFDREV